nr:reverse transcriptase domain-containing protein [Tanacetum cinerariifolium]
MSAMANTTPIVTTVTKTTNKENTPKEADAALKDNILDFFEEHYEDILPVIMDKIRRGKRKEVHARLKFEENPRKSRRVREGSQNSSARTLPARYRNPSERPKIRDRLKYNDGDVFDWLGQIRGIVLAAEDVLADGTLLAEIVLEAEAAPVTLKNHTLIPAPPKRQGLDIDITLVTGTAPQKKYVKDRVKIHNIKQRDEETIKDFIERFKVETGRMKGDFECMRIFGFMHGVNNPELTKRLNEHVSNTMEEMITATTSFIRGETATVSKKKGHTS